MVTVLITGGAGFIGSHFVRYMLKNHADYRVINFDALTYAGNLNNLRDVESDSRYRFMQGDVTRPQEVHRAMRGVDYVVHIAAESYVDRSIDESAVFVKTNVLGTHHLLEAARRHQVKRFVHVSTDEVYGSLGPTGYFSENTPLAPSNPYSASKAASDLLVRSYYETYKFPAIITRCSNNYGPFQFLEKLIALMITNALLDMPLPVYGDGMHVRDWLYVDDHSRAIDLVLHNGKIGEVYNIGSNNEWRNIDVVKLVLTRL